MDLNEIVIFIKVVQAGSFTEAAKQLAMPNSTVSSKISSLEKRLGTTLIRRTTRRLSITPAGDAYFKKCLTGFEEIKSGEDEIVAIQSEPHGLLRITAPVELGSNVLPSVVADYSRRYPKVSVEVILTDRRVELLAENVDLAVRAGRMKDSSLIVKKLGQSIFVPFASPKYLKRAGKIEHPRDLRQHDCLHFTPLGSEMWQLVGSHGTLHILVPGRVVINDLNMIKSLAVSGAGIALLPPYICRNELASNKLVPVLPGWTTVPSPVHFVYPAQRFVSAKLSAFVALATDPIREALAISDSVCGR